MFSYYLARLLMSLLIFAVLVTVAAALGLLE